MTLTDTKALQLLGGPGTNVMMPVLLPHLSALTELVRQMAQEEIEVLVGFRKRIFEDLEQLLDCSFLGCMCDLLGEQLEVLAGVSQISLCIHRPALLQMTWD